MSEERETQGRVRLEIVPFPGSDDEQAWRADDPVPDPPTVTRSKEATGWASSGLAGALRRQKRRSEG